MNEDERLQKARRERIRESFEAPVLALEGYASLLSDQFGTLVDDQLAKALAADQARIDAAIAQLKALVSEALDWAGSNADGHADDSQADADSQRIRHDMRNALGAVTGYAELIAEALEDEDSLGEPVAVCLTRLQRESETLLATLDQLDPGARADGPGVTEQGEVEAIFESLGQADERADDIPGRILVVDDNESNRSLLAHQLTVQGHEVHTAASGRAALALMDESLPDLVLLDLMMPDMNGFEVLKIMHARAELRNVPVIVITGLHDQQGVVRCIEAGAQDYLVKPLNPVILRARMRACLERKAWRDREQRYQRQLERSYEFIRKVFGRYLSDDVVRQILDEKDGLKLGGGLQTVTIMMTDLRGFTELSQKLAPTDVVSLLNLYLEEMSAIIVRYGGTIDEIIGDAILVLFGAPLARADDAGRAVACALEMQLAMDKVNAQAAQLGLPAVEMGVGINTGEVVVGNIGSEIRSKFAVVGHHVNLTGRIESFSVGGQVLVSEYTAAEIGEALECGRSFEVDAKGIDQPVTLHEIIGIGEPWSVRLEPADEALAELEVPLPVRFTELTDKKLDGPDLAGQIEALGSHRAVLSCVGPLDAMVNLRLRAAPEAAAFGSEARLEIYAKVIEPCTARGPGRYHIVLTSVAASARLRALVNKAPPASGA